MTSNWIGRVSARQRMALGGVALLAIGAAGGGGALSLTRPAIEMAPTVPTDVAKLPSRQGIVTVRGKVAEVFGDRFIVQDATGRVMVDAGRGGGLTPTAGSQILVQGRYDNGQLRARFLVDGAGNVAEVGPPPHGHGPHPERDGPPPPPPGRDGPPPLPQGAAPPPPPTKGSVPATPASPGADAPTPAPAAG